MDNISVYEQLRTKECEYSRIRMGLEQCETFAKSLNEIGCVDFIIERAFQFLYEVEKMAKDYLSPPVIQKPEAITDEVTYKPRKHVRRNIFNTPILKFKDEKHVRMEILTMVSLCKEHALEVSVEAANTRKGQYNTLVKGYIVQIAELDLGNPAKRVVNYVTAFNRLWSYLQSKGLR